MPHFEFEGVPIPGTEHYHNDPVGHSHALWALELGERLIPGPLAVEVDDRKGLVCDEIIDVSFTDVPENLGLPTVVNR